VIEAIDESMAIESEAASRAGALGFMSRALTLASLPYKDPKSVEYTRQNGDFKLRILGGYEGGVPYGVYPRLLMSWVTTEAVRTQSPELNLGPSLSSFLTEVMDIGRGGGSRGSSTRVSEQMKRLFGSFITAQYTGKMQDRGFLLKNILMVEEAELMDADMARLDRRAGSKEEAAGDALWQPQKGAELGTWQSKLRLTNSFFQECVTSPVPIDVRAYKALRGSAMAMDIYTWLTYRMSYTSKETRPLRWEALQMQFGTSLPTDEQGKRDFKKAFLKNLQIVLTVYPQANVELTDRGIVLKPSRPHIPQAAPQARLF
jgi:hypothetical protein